jgi:5'-nucleotidase
MKILLTNDDGVLAPGIAALARAVAHWVERCPSNEERQALVVAPDRNYSGMSSAVGDVFELPTVPYERHWISGAESIPTYGVQAPPALCAIIGSLGSFGMKPDLVISGINAGANVGRSVLHSGTVGAIMSAAQLGLSGLAVSVQWGEDVHYDLAAQLAIEVLDELFRAPSRTLLNLNVPNLTREHLRGVRRGRISTAEVLMAAGPDAGGAPIGDKGELPLLLGAASPMVGDVSDEDEGDDGALVVAGFASLTPIVGPHENTDAALDDVIHTALGVISRHLAVETP